MTADVVQLRPSQLVETLEAALENARSGRCTGFALVANMHDGDVLVYTGIKPSAFTRIHYEIGRMYHRLHRLAFAVEGD